MILIPKKSNPSKIPQQMKTTVKEFVAKYNPEVNIEHIEQLPVLEISKEKNPIFISEDSGVRKLFLEYALSSIKHDPNLKGSDIFLLNSKKVKIDSNLSVKQYSTTYMAARCISKFIKKSNKKGPWKRVKELDGNKKVIILDTSNQPINSLVPRLLVNLCEIIPQSMGFHMIIIAKYPYSSDVPTYFKVYNSYLMMNGFSEGVLEDTFKTPRIRNQITKYNCYFKRGTQSIVYSTPITEIERVVENDNN